MRLLLAQLNPVVGDVKGNTALVRQALARAIRAKSDVVVTSELALLGYPPRDLLLREGVVEACERAVHALAKECEDVTLVVGHPRRRTAPGRKPFHNSASVCQHGRVVAVYDKQLLPGYDVFDEDRHFEPGSTSCLFDAGGTRTAVLICEDLWRADDLSGGAHLKPVVSRDPAAEAVKAGAGVIVVLSASPFVVGKGARHAAHVESLAGRHGIMLALVNQAGGNDDVVFDGRSMVASPRGMIAAAPAFEEADLVVDMSLKAPALSWKPQPAAEEMFDALVTGVRDYARKTGHGRLMLGLSGGIDSALVCVIAARAVGAAQVTGVLMPSRHSSRGSMVDARSLAANLGLGETIELPIEAAHRTFGEALTPMLGSDATTGLTDENIQARVRGVLLMALSNARGALVLATGNKSELAMGYCTLYGDMAGALAPLGDVTKIQVYELARWINDNHGKAGFSSPPIPAASINKPPSAELRPNQTDQDTLPPYDVLDEVIRRAVDMEQAAGRIASETGFDIALVERIVGTLDRAEYKRMQAPIVLKTSPRAFGPGRPMPAAMRLTVGDIP